MSELSKLSVDELLHDIWMYRGNGNINEILTEIRRRLEAAETPREPIIIPPGMTKTQIEVAGLGPPREQGECAARKALVEAAIPLEVLASEIRASEKSYPSMSIALQAQILASVDSIRVAIAQLCRSSMTREEAEKIAADKLADGFGDPIAHLNCRNWLQKAVEAKGAKVTGGGVGCGQADIDIELEGHRFNVSIRPL